MPTFLYRKLVRDNIWQLELDAGHTPTGKRLHGLALRRAMADKLREEAAELPLDETGQAVTEELADLQQVLDDLAAECGVTKTAIEAARADKFAKKGGFRGGVYIDAVDIPDETDPFAVKFRQDPAKYPEVPAHFPAKPPAKRKNNV